MSERYDAIVVGTGFASSMFLHRYLQRNHGARVLVLERGEWQKHPDRVAKRLVKQDVVKRSFNGSESKKPWTFTLGFAWTTCASTPRASSSS